MNILFISHKWQAQTGESCVSALRALGHTAEISWAKIGTVSPGLTLYHRLKRCRYIGRSLSNAEIYCLNSLMIKKALHMQPDLIIVNAGGEISTETLRIFRQKTDAKIVCWAADDPSTYVLGPYYLEGVRFYDHYFLVDSSWYTNKLKAAGLKKCSILQYGVDPTIYKPLKLSKQEKKKYGAAVCHLGAPHKERLEILGQLIDFDVALWGATSTKLFKRFSRLPKPLLSKVMGGVVPARTSNKIYNASNICLNIQHRQLATAPSNKTFEITASGSFLLTTFYDANERWFANDEIISFKDVKELRKLLIYYLKHDQEREELASKAYQRTISSHQYIHRLKELLSECGF